MYHPYIVRHLRTRRLFSIRGPPLSTRYPASCYAASAAVICATHQAGFHKEGNVLYCFHLQYGELMEKVEGQERRWRVRLGESEEELKERLKSMDKQLVDPGWSRPEVLELDEQFIFPLSDGWKERYGVQPPPPPSGGKKKFHEVQREQLRTLRAQQRRQAGRVTDAEDDDSGEDFDGEVGRGRSGTVEVHSPQLIDLVDSDDGGGAAHSADELAQPQDGDDSALASSQQPMGLSTPTLHSLEDPPPSPLPLPLVVADLPSTASAPADDAVDAARLQVVMPLSPPQEPKKTAAAMEAAAIDLHAMDVDTGEDEGEDGDEDGDEEGDDDTRLLAADGGERQRNGAVQLGGVGVYKKEDMDPASSVSIFAMMKLVH